MIPENIHTYSDEELYLLLGDKQVQGVVLSELFKRHSSRVYLYCQRILGDAMQADDIFQEAFLKLLQCAREGRVVGHVPAYLLRIARNLCFNANRSVVHTTVPLEDAVLYGDGYRAVESKEVAQLVAMALELLSEEYREALALQVYGELSYKEIAEVLDVPVTTVRNRVVRAKKKVRDVLAGYMQELRGEH